MGKEIERIIKERKANYKALYGNVAQKGMSEEQFIAKAIEQYIAKQQKINNEVLADKCDEMDRMAKRHEQHVIKANKPVLDIYEKFKDVPHYHKTDDDFREIWNAIEELNKSLKESK